MKALGIVVLVIGTTSCVTYDRCVDKFGNLPNDTLLIEHVVEIPRDSIIHTLKIDSIELLLPGDTVVIESPESRAQIRYWRNQYENSLGIMALCDTVIVRDTIEVSMPVILQPPAPGKLERAWLTWQLIAAFTLPLLLFTLFIYQRIKR